MSRNKTLDGRPLSIGVSGFVHYSTTSCEAPNKPAPILTPAQLLAYIHKFREEINDPKYEVAFKKLIDHINDKNNPHGTTLDLFTQDVADVLYEKYKELGGVASKEYYIRSLFQTLRISTPEELSSSTSQTLDNSILLSVNAARKFLDEHENNLSAHSSIFEALFPGTPPSDPVFGIMGYFGISKSFISQVTDDPDHPYAPYSYIAKSGYLEYCNSINELPVDYSYSEGMIPCFGTRTNMVEESCNFGICRPINVTLIADAEVAPDKSITATAVFSNTYSGDAEHRLLYPSIYLPMKEARTFSVYAKAEKCQYLAIRYQDLVSSDLIVDAIFDLKNGTCLCKNHMNRYKASIFKLANGWFRCCLSMYHEIGQEYDLAMTFFKDSDTENFKYAKANELCGYLWGMQFEVGNNPSPYIPTNGDQKTRKGLKITIDLSTNNIPTTAFTCDFEFLNPKDICEEDIIRPLFSMYKVTKDNLNQDVFSKSVGFEIRRIGTIDLTQYGTLTVGTNTVTTIANQLVFPAHNTFDYDQIVFGSDYTNTIIKINDTDAIDCDVDSDWIKPTRFYIGCDNDNNFMEGYLKSITIYPYKVSADEAVFLTGEEIHG